MIECEATVRKWGNSFGVIIPRDVVENSKIKENSRIKFALLEGGDVVAETFGMLKGWNEDTGKALKKLRKEAWHE